MRPRNLQQVILYHHTDAAPPGSLGRIITRAQERLLVLAKEDRRALAQHAYLAVVSLVGELYLSLANLSKGTLKC